MSGLRVTVVGGGIGGAAAALALTRAGCDVHVYEQVASKTEVGAGIQVSPNATRLLHRYGLADALRARAVKPWHIEVRRWDDGRILSREELGDIAEEVFGAPYYHFHRADLLSILTDALPVGRAHSGRRCVDVVQTKDGARTIFDDGSTIDSDVVVGADGIHSVVRKILFGDERPRFSGNVAYRGLAPADRLAHLNLRHNATNWMGPGGHFVHYFVSGGRFVNFVAVSEQEEWERESWNDRGQIEDAKKCFTGWHPQIHEILGAVDQTFKWALFDRAPLSKWGVGRVTLLGDACPSNAALHGAGRRAIDRRWCDTRGLPLWDSAFRSCGGVSKIRRVAPASYGSHSVRGAGQRGDVSPSGRQRTTETRHRNELAGRTVAEARCDLRL
jgi:salicylate hydroxylase